MKWLPADNDLDQQQRGFKDGLSIDDSNKYIVGFPGSGKTVLILYSLVELKKKNRNAKIIIIEFTHALIKMLSAAVDDLNEEERYKNLNLKDVDIVTYYDFYDHYNQEYFDYILCDEVQDIPVRVIERMNKSAGRIITAGDHSQSIYTEDPKWRKHPCTHEEIIKIINPDVTKLNIIHRLTRHIISAVNSYMPELDIMSGRPSMVKTSIQIRLWKSDNQSDEVMHVMDEAIARINNNDSVGILLRTHRQIADFANKVLENAHKPRWKFAYNEHYSIDFGSLNEHLESQGIPMVYVANGYGDFDESQRKITLTTYHSSKGLDFDTVFLPYCNDNPKFNDVIMKRLFMVAMTRSRKDLFISYTTMMNQFVKCFKDECKYVNWATVGITSLSFDDDKSDEFGF